ncbi:MAG: creatininase family protein [Bacteroidota bacterium]
MNGLLSDLTWVEAKEMFKSGSTVIIPVGSNEQHGPHMPVNCDSFFVTSVVTQVAKKLEGKVPVYYTPTIWTGFSPHHRDFPGTITLRLETLLSLVYDICDSLIYHNVRRIMIINGHGGNAIPLRAAGSKIGDELGNAPFVLSYWDVLGSDWESLIKERPAGIGHAGESETSLRLFLAPETIRKEELERADFIANDVQPERSAIYQFQRWQNITYKGYTGYPKWGTAEKGKQIYETIIERLCELIHSDYRKWMEMKE